MVLQVGRDEVGWALEGKGGTWKGGNGRPLASVPPWDQNSSWGLAVALSREDYDAVSSVCNTKWKGCITAKYVDGSLAEFRFLQNGHFNMSSNFKFFPKKISPYFLIYLLCWSLSTFLVCITDNSTWEIWTPDHWLTPFHLPGWHILQNSV